MSVDLADVEAAGRVLRPGVVIMSTTRHPLLTTIACTVIGLQAAPLVVGRLFWPFLDYPMYSITHGPPVQTQVFEAVVHTAEGESVVADAEFMGLNLWAWKLERVQPALDEADPQAIAAFEAQVRRQTGLTPVRLELVIDTHELTEAGLVQTRQMQQFLLGDALAMQGVDHDG